MYKKPMAFLVVLWIGLSAYAFLSEGQVLSADNQGGNFYPAPVPSELGFAENYESSNYRALVKFLAQNRVDENEYKRLTLEEEVELAENMGLPVVYAENMQEFKSALPAPIAFSGNTRREIVREWGAGVNTVVVFENETTFRVAYDYHSLLDNAIRERNYMCLDFAKDLQRYAVGENFRCAYAEVSLENLPYRHAIDAFEIDNTVLFVEPQTDRIIGPLSVGSQLDGDTVENISLYWDPAGVPVY